MTKNSATTAAQVDVKRAVDLVMEMMAIPGKSCEEGRVVGFLRQQLRKAGVPAGAIVEDNTPKRSPAGGEVGSLIVKLPGTVRGPRRLLMAHVDTVPLCVGARPVRKGPVIESKDPDTALGGDDRAGASVVLMALLTIFREKLPHPPLTFFWPVQEEIGLYGARYVSRGKLGGPKLCFNWDGGAPHLISIGATGDYSLTIEITGIASHAGAHPEEGVSALTIASLAIADLSENGWHGLVVKGKHRGSSNIGVIAGGDATNVVMPHLKLRAEARSHDPEFRKEIVAAFRGAFDRAAARVKNSAGQTGGVRFESELKYESFRLPLDEPCVRSALAAAEAVGLKPEAKISNGGLDANWMTAHGFPTVTLGCGQQAIHTVDESLHVDSYLHACRMGLVLATGAV
jgi:tripeptide aminopeptidase